MTGSGRVLVHLLLALCTYLRGAKSQDFGLTLNNVAYTNNSIVNITDIGTDAAALICTSTRPGCCLSTDGSQWYFPNGSAVQRNGNTYYRRRTISDVGGGTIRLHRNPGATLTGVFHCDIPEGGGLQSIYVGIYTATTGSPRVTSLTFSDQSRTFICTSTGGPATTVTWRRDGSPLVVDGVTYQQTQTVTDATTATYQNVLTIAQSVTSIYGEYRCTVENARGTSSGLEVIVSALLQVLVSLGQNPTLGQPYTLTCNVSVASGSGIPTVQWVGPGSSAPITTGGDFTLSSTSPYILTINPLRQSHAGQYTCEATVQNVTITASESLAVDVSEISVVITSSGVPTVGQSYSLTCSVTGADYLNSTINYRWFETGDPGVVLARSVNLQLPPLRPTEDSHYTCQATISSPYLTEDLTFNQTQDVSITTPSGSPQNFTVTQRRARNMTFSWSPPAPTERNGVITGYFLSCVPEAGGRSSISMQYTTAGTFTLGGFTPATSYNCSIAASNSQGSGPLAYVDVTTLDDAMLFQLRLSRLPTCVNWVTVNTDAKLNDIIGAVVQNTELSCQCTLSTERITGGAFRCFENSEQQVTFRARLHGTAQVTSSQLLVYIEQWKARGVTIAVQGVRLSVDRACILGVSAFDDLECEVPSSVNAAIIGSVVAVAVLLIVVAGIVIVVVVFLKRHQAKHVLQKRTGEDQPVVMQWSKLSEPETPGITTKEPDLKTGPEEAPSDYELPMTQCAAYGQGFNPGDRIEDAVYEKVE